MLKQSTPAKIKQILAWREWGGNGNQEEKGKGAEMLATEFIIRKRKLYVGYFEGSQLVTKVASSNARLGQDGIICMMVLDGWYLDMSWETIASMAIPVASCVLDVSLSVN